LLATTSEAARKQLLKVAEGLAREELTQVTRKQCEKKADAIMQLAGIYYKF
jgi:hypothetical protein